MFSKTIAMCALSLLIISCNGKQDAGQESDSGTDYEPLWKADYEKMLQAKRDRMIELANNSPTYPRPQHDPSLVATTYRNEGPNEVDRIAVKNTENGDVLVTHSADDERMTIVYAFRLHSGELVSFYHVQFAPGYPEEIDFVPYRLFAITHNATPTPDALAARERVSPEFFARYLASSSGFVEKPDKKFLVIDAPLEKSEAL